jgi:hypothetical protein
MATNALISYELEAAPWEVSDIVALSQHRYIAAKFYE